MKLHCNVFLHTRDVHCEEVNNSSLAKKVFTVSVCVITLLSEPCIFLLSSFNNSKISDKYANDSPQK